VTSAAESGRRAEVVPMSFAEESLWFLDRLAGGGSAAYNIPLAVEVQGPLDRSALVSALRRLAQRHESLRAAYRERDGLPIKLVLPQASLELTTAVVNTDDPREFRVRAMEIFDGIAARPFALSHPPLARVHLLSASPVLHALFFNFHHLIADGWSIDVFNRELSAAYGAAVAGVEPDLPALDVDYVDYAAWQREWMESDQCRHDLASWRTLLAELPPPLDLAMARPRTRAALAPGGNAVLSVSSRLVAELRQQASATGVTLSTLLFCALQLLLGRHGRQSSITIGLPAANRPFEALERVIGLFVNSVVVPGRVDLDATVAVHLQRTQDTILEAMAASRVPFDRVVAEVDPTRDASYNPLFQVMFGLEPASLTLRLPETTSVRLRPSNGFSKFDLSFLGEEADDGSITFELEYRRDLFTPAIVSRLGEQYRWLLAALASAPGATPLRSLPLSSAEERAQVLAFSRGA
jgi:hypothetical protein